MFSRRVSARGLVKTDAFAQGAREGPEPSILIDPHRACCLLARQVRVSWRAMFFLFYILIVCCMFVGMMMMISNPTMVTSAPGSEILCTSRLWGLHCFFSFWGSLRHL